MTKQLQRLLSCEHLYYSLLVLFTDMCHMIYLQSFSHKWIHFKNVEMDHVKLICFVQVILLERITPPSIYI